MSDIICSGCKGASSSGCYLCNPSAAPAPSEAVPETIAVPLQFIQGLSMNWYTYEQLKAKAEEYLVANKQEAEGELSRLIQRVADLEKWRETLPAWIVDVRKEREQEQSEK